MTEAVQTRVDGAVIEVTLDRPRANAIDAETSRELGRVFADFRDDPDLRVAILTGAGDRFFSAGWDLRAAAEGAGRIVSAAPLAVGAAMAVARLTGHLPLQEAFGAMRSGGLEAYEQMLASEDSDEGPRAFTEKREPAWKGR